MTTEQFRDWLKAMIESGRAKSKSDCANQLGVTYRQLRKWERGDLYPRYYIALACAALMVDADPWGI